jgi:hypothetical protein
VCIGVLRSQLQRVLQRSPRRPEVVQLHPRASEVHEHAHVVGSLFARHLEFHDRILGLVKAHVRQAEQVVTVGNVVALGNRVLQCVTRRFVVTRLKGSLARSVCSAVPRARLRWRRGSLHGSRHR